MSYWTYFSKKGLTMTGKLTILFLLALLFAASCDYARMRDQESVRTWEKQMPAAPDYTIPTDGGYQVLAHTQPASLRNPVTDTLQSVERGRIAYSYFCIQCHGRNLKGYGTVGQSFSPLPSDLTATDVLQQSDGELYYKIRMGFKRHPPLFTTVSDTDTWSIVNYVRTQKGKMDDGDNK